MTRQSIPNEAIIYESINVFYTPVTLFIITAITKLSVVVVVYATS